MSETARPQQHGRVTEDGTVYVITSNGERRVGQVPDVDKSEALAFFTRRFDALETEVKLLEQRVHSATVSPEEARKAAKNQKRAILEANAVGDLEGLAARLDDLMPYIEAAQQARREERARQLEEAKAAKEQMVEQAERLANSNDWRGGVNKFRNLLEEWKRLPRIDRATDDELWRRFSSARTAYTRRRKAQFAAENERREQARKIKERIVAEAAEIENSTDWGETAAQFRSLMSEWKAAGGAGRNIDDKLWAQFRASQDKFFGARSAAFNAEEAEYQENQLAKEKLLSAAEEKILPVGDSKEARAAYREFLTEYNQYGRVPRDAIRPLEARVRAIEEAIKTAEEAEWRRSDPDARKRAADTVAMFSSQIEKLTKQLEKAKEAGDKAKVTSLTESINTYAEWLEQAEKALAEFTTD